MKKLNIVMLGPSIDEKGGMGAVQQLILTNVRSDVEIRHIFTWDEQSNRYFVFLKALILFTLRLIRGEVDLVHIHMSEGGSALRKSILAVLAFSFSKPVFMHAHGCEFHLFHARLPQILRQWLNRILQNTVLIVLSESWKRFYVEQCGISSEQITVLPNPVVIPEAVPKRINSNPITIVFLAKINQRKGVYDLLKALAQLPPEKASIKLIIAGSGELQQAVDLAKALNVESLVEFPGWIDQMQRDKLLAQADIFVLPSYNEGLPMALLEAMSWGLPVITTSVGGIPDLVTHNQTGLLLQPGDIPQLSELLELTIKDERLRLRLGNAAAKRVAPLNLSNYIERLESLYYSTSEKHKQLKLTIAIRNDL